MKDVVLRRKKSSSSSICTCMCIFSSDIHDSFSLTIFLEACIDHFIQYVLLPPTPSTLFFFSDLNPKFTISDHWVDQDQTMELTYNFTLSLLCQILTRALSASLALSEDVSFFSFTTTRLTRY